ncbi:hypothetical protein BJ742DRAFT_873465 [Cladochytrium replicatum]|nr:hypothetical protein BJ742DRAFT_873465 [Cladochytrium replicatum]
MAPVTFYDNALAYNTARVRIVLQEKNLPYTPISLNLMNGQSLSPEYAKVNPNLWAPTLITADGKTLTDSMSCSRYVDSADGKPLGSAEGVDAAKVDEWVDRIAQWDGNLFMRAQGSPTVLKVLAQANDFKIKFSAARAKEHPHLKEIYERKINALTNEGKPSEADIQANYDNLTDLITKAESALATSPYLAGPAYSLADAHFTVVIWRVHATSPAAAAKFLDSAKYPKVNEYFEKVKARPSYAKTFAGPGLSGLVGMIGNLAKFQYSSFTGSY